jgi:DNA mismatch repair protein MSH3
MAIANATLQHLVRNTRCKTLFITHYPLVASELERTFPAEVENIHMGYREETQIDGTRNITFLYRLTAGLAPASFGVECARLAGLPESILDAAAHQSQDLKSTVEERMGRNK